MSYDETELKLQYWALNKYNLQTDDPVNVTPTSRGTYLIAIGDAEAPTPQLLEVEVVTDVIVLREYTVTNKEVENDR